MKRFSKVLVSGFFMGMMVCTHLAAEQPGLLSGESGGPTAIAIPDIERAIQQVVQPLDEKLVGDIALAIGEVEDAAEQNRLQELLNDRIALVVEGLPQPVAVSANPVTVESSDDVFIERIAALNLKSDATAAEVQARDEVVSAIIGISDPLRREKFLKMLEQREREAETLLEASPKES